VLRSASSSASPRSETSIVNATLILQQPVLILFGDADVRRTGVGPSFRCRALPGGGGRRRREPDGSTLIGEHLRGLNLLVFTGFPAG
jgi:hypothetical protein